MWMTFCDKILNKLVHDNDKVSQDNKVPCQDNYGYLGSVENDIDAKFTETNLADNKINNKMNPLHGFENAGKDLESLDSGGANKIKKLQVHVDGKSTYIPHA